MTEPRTGSDQGVEARPGTPNQRTRSGLQGSGSITAPTDEGTPSTIEQGSSGTTGTMGSATTTPGTMGSDTTGMGTTGTPSDTTGTPSDTSGTMNTGSNEITGSAVPEQLGSDYSGSASNP